MGGAAPIWQPPLPAMSEWSAHHTAPNADQTALRAAQLVDLVLIPCRASTFDLEAITGDADARRAGEEAQLCKILNAIRPRSGIGREAAEGNPPYGKTAAETLLTIAADPKHLGARIGLTAVLHTWGSALTHHPHVEGAFVGERRQIAEKGQAAGLVERGEALEKEAAEQAREHAHGQEEAGLAGDPARTVRRQAAATACTASPRKVWMT